MFFFFLVTFFPLCMIFAALSDILTMTIPNRLCLLLAAGFPLAAFVSDMTGPEALTFAGFGLVVFFVGFALFAFGLIGGGDAKLLAAAAFWVGPSAALPFLVVATGARAVLALSLLYVRSVTVPVTGFAFADRLLSKETGVPYGVALSIAGLYVFADGPFVEAAMQLL